jgi:hypothetical protein
MSFAYKKIVFSFVLLTFSIVSWGLKIVDIDESDFGKNIKHTMGDGTISFASSSSHVRMVAFDISEQKFDGIYYFMSQHKKTFTTAERFGISLSYGNTSGTFSITLNTDKLADDTWVLCPASYINTPLVPSLEKVTLVDAHSGKVLVRPKTDDYRSHDFLSERLQKFSAIRSKGATVSAKFRVDTVKPPFARDYDFPGTTGVYQVVGQSPHGVELGNLGELATDLTFLAHGFIKVPSKLNVQDNGFDGVYVDDAVKPTILWITEAKFRSRSLSESQLMPEIDKKINVGGALEHYRKAAKETLQNNVAELVDAFISQRPDKIMLLGQTVLTGGQIKSFINTFLKRFPTQATPVKAIKNEDDVGTAPATPEDSIRKAIQELPPAVTTPKDGTAKFLLQQALAHLPPEIKGDKTALQKWLMAQA